MNEFVEECRREWKRLRVPDPVANEMAADLEADLAEAAAEGASAEEVLGSGAFDPRAFAASWAAERGVARPSAPSEEQSPLPGWRPIWRPRILAGLAACGLVALVGAALALRRAGSQAIASPFFPRLPTPSFPPYARVFPLQVHDSAVYPGVLGLILLLLGLAGAALLVAYWLGAVPPRAGSSRRPYRDQTPGGPSYY